MELVLIFRETTSPDAKLVKTLEFSKSKTLKKQLIYLAL